MFPYDPQIRAAVAEPPRSIPEVVATMQRIDSLTAEGDGLKWFNWLYLEVTNAVGTRVGGGGFHDLVWMAELDVQFAGHYFSALRGWLDGQPTPSCWRALFERRNQPLIARIQFAMAGINAHINHDLALAIGATGIAPEHGTTQYQDYRAINQTLDGMVEMAKQHLMVRLLGDDLPVVTHIEETLASWNVAAAREAAWVNAEVLWHLRGVKVLWNRYCGALDGITAVAGKTLLVPATLVGNVQIAIHA